MAFQRFDADGKKMKSDYFVLHGKEVLDLAAFLALVVSPTDGLLEGDDGTRLTSAVIAGLLMDQSTERELYEKNKAELLELLKSDVSAPEVVALARRRREVEVFQELLNDGAAFASRLAKMSETKEKRPEDVWQDFFERNQWIFGSGLTTQFLHSWSADALSQTVVGSSVKRVGKRPDALMSTAGALSALVFVEIKTHATKLLAAEEYRGDAFRPGGKLVGAVAQCQATMDAAIEELGTELRKKDS
jgi:hypothetical protein